MELIYGLGMLLLGLIVTVTFFWLWFKIHVPAKKDNNDNEVLKRSGLLDKDPL